jgi:PAS domain S-box-containing protein
VQELVAIHGGSISVSSAVDVGTTFTVSIPLGRAHLPPERLHAPRALASTTLGAGPFVEEALRWLPDDLADRLGDDARPVIAADMEPHARLLVVDDNADMRAYLVHLLGSQWSVDVASNGEDALRLLRERRADLVITDVMMPGLTGFELIDAIRHDPDISSVPVIALSARAGEESRADGLDAGADDYVVKPFSARELTARVGASLKLARLRRETLVEHERSAVALRQAHEKYQALVWSTADSVWEADATGAIDVDAPSWRAVTGQSAADWIGFGWLDALHPDDRVRVEREWRDRIADSTTFDIEFRVRDQRGGWRWISLRAAPLPSAGGRAPRWIGMNTDITARRQAEEARDAFVGVLSHELRTPVTTILAASELLAQPGRDRDPAMTDELTRDVVGEARRLQRLVEDLLVLSRAERSELVVETEPVLIHHAIRAAVGAESVRFPNVRFDVDAPALPPVMADRTYVEQVLRNYVSNAAKYGGDMANVIVVAREEEAAITVRILDDGPGFPEASAGRLFDLFFRDPEAMRRQPGAGIGLFVTRTLVEAMGGQVWAKARDGGGAEFGFSLPAGDLE